MHNIGILRLQLASICCNFGPWQAPIMTAPGKAIVANAQNDLISANDACPNLQTKTWLELPTSLPNGVSSQCLHSAVWCFSKQSWTSEEDINQSCTAFSFKDKYICPVVFQQASWVDAVRTLWSYRPMLLHQGASHLLVGVL